jgi:methylenetetrahydrofolate reductase (NADPH)
MNAPVTFAEPAGIFQADPVADFLQGLSVEITPRQIDKLSVVAERLAPGARVYVALIDPADLAAQFEAVVRIRSLGLEPVPHIPARFVIDEHDLDTRIAMLAAKGGVRQALVLGGGAPQPLGKYDAAIQLLDTGVFQSHGITRIGMAGHPEGNSDITRHHGDKVLYDAVKAKQAYLTAHGLEGYIATQFLFEAAPVASWAKTLRAAGITLPIHVGVPGPATIKTLVKYAAVCGVGNSARFIRKQALNITKLLTVSTPDAFIADLAKLHAEAPELGIMAPHFYPFGGFDKLFEWLSTRRARS